MLVYGDVCSGISAPTVAWKPLGWRCAFYSEIEKAPRAVLAHHYPTAPTHGDFTTIKAGDYEPIDLLVGGTPCQDFSVAGLRKGLAGERGNLTLEFVRLAQRLQPRWLVYENVPGILSQDEGRAFGAFLGLLGECGYGFAYRILDAQYAGVAQRRERLFLVGHLGDWRRPAAVLFDAASLRWDSPPSREKGERVAPTIASRATAGGGLGTDFDLDGGLVARSLNAHPSRIDGESETFIVNGNSTPEVSHERAFPLRADDGSGNRQCIAHSLRADGFDASEDGTGKGTPLIPINFKANMSTPSRQHDISETLQAENYGAVAFSCKDHGADAGELSPTLRAMGHAESHANAGGQVAVCIKGAAIGREPKNGPQYGETREDGTSFTLNATEQHGVMTPQSGVRRLTPRECERLMAFSDDYTLVPYRNGLMKDGPRYKMLGNSMVVNELRWIGGRIEMVDRLTSKPLATPSD